MYQFPLFEEPIDSFSPPKELIKNSVLSRKTRVTHLLTHQKLNVVFWEFEMKNLFLNKKYEKIEIKKQAGHTEEINDDLTAAILFLEQDRSKNKVDTKIDITGLQVNSHKGA